jgi:hypothetical protein
MKLFASASAAFLISAGLIAGAQAHNGGHKLDDAQCSAAWKAASPNGEAISENQAEPYAVNFIILDVDGDTKLTAEEFKEGCTDGLMKSPDEATVKNMPSSK